MARLAWHDMDRRSTRDAPLWHHDAAKANRGESNLLPQLFSAACAGGQLRGRIAQALCKQLIAVNE